MQKLTKTEIFWIAATALGYRFPEDIKKKLKEMIEREKREEGGFRNE